MTISRVKEIIEKRFQITMTRNRSYQILWHSGDERILVSNIRSDYKIIEIEKGLATLKMPFANEKQLIQILNYFVNIAGELNKNNKRKHSIKFVMKIINELNLTLSDVREQVYKCTGHRAIKYLKNFNAEQIRYILNYDKEQKEKKKENESSRTFK